MSERSKELSLDVVELGTASVETKGPNTTFVLPDLGNKTGNNPYPPED